MQMRPLDVTLERWRVEWGGIVPSATSAPSAPSPSRSLFPPTPTWSRLTSASRCLDGLLLAADGPGTGLINEMYDNVISLIE